MTREEKTQWSPCAQRDVRMRRRRRCARAPRAARPGCRCRGRGPCRPASAPASSSVTNGCMSVEQADRAAPRPPCGCIERPTRQTRRPAAWAARMTDVHARDVGGEAGDGDLALQRADQLGPASRARRLPSPPSPSTKTLVESQTMASTPSSPRRRMASSSVDAADQRIGIDLPVAGVQHHAQRRADGQAVRLGDRVGERDQLDLERAERDRARRAGSR